MARVTLEDMTLVKIGTTLWLHSEVKHLMRKYSSGIINMEKAVPVVKSIAFKFPINERLKNRLIDVIEKIGYELYLFLTKPYVEHDFELETIKWTIDGLINGSDTLRNLIRKTGKCSISEFRYSCELFDESLITEIWTKLKGHDCQLHRYNDAFTTYWTAIMNHDLNFHHDFTSATIGFKRSRSFEMNMLLHSIAVNNHAAVNYFHRRLQQSDLDQLGFCLTNQYEILQFTLITCDDSSFSYILSFLEVPVQDKTARQLIINKLIPSSIKKILDHVLRRINVCGDLHYNIFRYLLFALRHKWTTEVRDNLHFYALNLLSKGRLEKFHFLPDKDYRSVLRRQILHKVKCRQGLGIFVTIYWNNYSHLLVEFLEWLADNEQDKQFFREFVLAVADGRQYDQ